MATYTRFTTVGSRIVGCSLVVLVSSLASSNAFGTADLTTKTSNIKENDIQKLRTTFKLSVTNQTAIDEIKDFHVCIGTDADATLEDVKDDVEFENQPTGWTTSVTKVGDAFYLNWYKPTGGVALSNTNRGDFKVKVRKSRFKKGKPTYIFTKDGNEAIGNAANQINPAAINKDRGPILLSAAGGCTLPSGDCTTATEEACSIEGGVFDLASPCVSGACCTLFSCSEDSGEFDCIDEGSNAAYFGDNTTCDDFECEPAVSTASEWGVIVMTLLMLTVATVVIGRRRRPAAA